MDMQQRNRHGEQGGIPFRSSRFYSVNGEWFFAIRRGPDRGPFVNKAEAKKALVNFLHEQFTAQRAMTSSAPQSAHPIGH